MGGKSALSGFGGTPSRTALKYGTFVFSCALQVICSLSFASTSFTLYAQDRESFACLDQYLAAQSALECSCDTHFHLVSGPSVLRR